MIIKRSLAIGRDSEVVAEVLSCVRTEATAGESFEERTPVGAVEPVLVGLDPGVTSGYEGWVAGLERERVHEEVEPDDVALGTTN